jgi:23S rRNA (uridine2552-2'-O)-methyltransferase
MTRPQILSKLIPHNVEISLKSFKHTHSSNQWLERHHRDPYVKRAVKETYRARSAFKLIEINEKYKFIHPGDVVVDLGASPGSWSQVAIKLTNSEGMDSKMPKGIVASVDRDFIEPLGPGAKVFSHSDINDSKTFEKLKEALEGKKANSILSDMVR